MLRVMCSYAGVLSVADPRRQLYRRSRRPLAVGSIRTHAGRPLRGQELRIRRLLGRRLRARGVAVFRTFPMSIRGSRRDAKAIPAVSERLRVLPGDQLRLRARYVPPDGRIVDCGGTRQNAERGRSAGAHRHWSVLIT